MIQEDFVDGLPIVSDDRLRGRGAIVPAPDDPRRGGPKDSGPPEPIGDNLRAAVNAGSIISFTGGVSAAEKEDVLYSTQLAQRAASARHDRFAATKDWYDVYVDVLERLGWVGEGFAFEKRMSASGELSMDRTALDVLMSIATQGQLAILTRTFDFLKKLGDADEPLRLFDMQSQSGLSGNFQVGAVQRAENGALSLALGAFHFRSNDQRGGVIFIRWGKDEVEFWTGAQKLTLNEALYAQHRSAVAAKLSKDAADYIATLKFI